MRKSGLPDSCAAHRQGITSGDVVIANSFTKCSEQIVFSSKIVLQVAQRYPGLGCHATQCKLRVSAIYQNMFCGRKDCRSSLLAGFVAISPIAARKCFPARWSGCLWQN